MLSLGLSHTHTHTPAASWIWIAVGVYLNICVWEIQCEGIYRIECMKTASPAPSCSHSVLFNTLDVYLRCTERKISTGNHSCWSALRFGFLSYIFFIFVHILQDFASLQIINSYLINTTDNSICQNKKSPVVCSGELFHWISVVIWRTGSLCSSLFGVFSLHPAVCLSRSWTNLRNTHFLLLRFQASSSESLYSC